MICIIDNKPVLPEAIARREMNFGQRVHCKTFEYKITIPKKEFIFVIHDEFQTLVRETHADKPYHEYGKWLELDYIMNMETVNLEVLANTEPRIFERLVKWIILEVFDLLFPPKIDTLKFVLVNVQKITLEREVIIEGQAI